MTDTSRIADLRFQVSEKMPINHSDLSCLFDRIEALEAENERLRGVLGFAMRTLEAEGFNDDGPTLTRIRAALGEKQ